MQITSPEIIFSNIDSGLIILDKDLKVTYWNEWLEIRSKVKKEDVLDKHLCDSFPYINEKKLRRKVKTTLLLNSQTFYTVENDKNLLKIPLSSITGGYYDFMQQSITVAPYDVSKGEVCLIIYDQTALSTSLQKVHDYQEVLEEKIELELQNNRALQTIMDVNNHMQLISDGVAVTFANRAFFNFMKLNDLKDFSNQYECFSSLFEKDDNYLYDGVQAPEETFVQHLIESSVKDRRVAILDKITGKRLVFLVDITLTDKEKELYLWSFTDITAIELDNEDLVYQVFHDSLTKVYNRFKLEEILKREINLYNRYQKEFCIAIIDIDHFKNFNDTHGHLIGDEVLISFAQAIDKNMRVTDVFARWGGEEFVAVFINATIEESSIAIEKVQQSISAVEHKTAGKVTASFGLTKIKADDDINAMMKRADDALYRAKENGRNRYEVQL